MSEENSRPPLPTLLDVERAISELQRGMKVLQELERLDSHPWHVERGASIERVCTWLELELGPLLAELGGVAHGPRASDIEVPAIEGIRRVLLERISTAPAPSSSALRNFTPSDLGELRTPHEQRAPHGRCPECNEALCHYTGPEAGAVLCPHCDADQVHELIERNGGDGNAPLCAACGMPTNSIDREGRCADCHPVEVYVQVPAGVKFDRTYVNRGPYALHFHGSVAGVATDMEGADHQVDGPVLEVRSTQESEPDE